MFTDEIQRERNEAHETKVANTIMDLLDKLQLNSNESSCRRWIWELIQNAKDVVNSTGKVSIKINFDEENNIIEFKHNGKLFTTKNLVYLIEQVSTKDRENLGYETTKVTGKFGTGFLTTHLLSEKVNISGILQGDDEKPRAFSFELDRTGKNKADIIKGIHNSYEQLDKSKELSTDIIVDENNFNTIFTYRLDKSGMEVARKGLNDLYISLPYVFTFVPELVSIDTYDCSYKRGMVYNTKNENIKVYEIIFMEKGKDKKIYICSLKEDDVSVAIGVTPDDNNIEEYSQKLPRIFCDFPLVGTEDFAFPIVVNSYKFNPTEPRDCIFLSDKENPKIDENKALISKACELYGNLLDYVSEEGWEKTYNITKINLQPEKTWISSRWINKNVVEKCREYIKYKYIIDTEDSKRKALYDEFLDESNIWIISANNEKHREKIWELANDIQPSMLIRRSEIHNWYNSLWDKCHNFTLKDLVKKVDGMVTLQKLEETLLGERTVIEWLNKLYSLISEDGTIQKYILDKKVKIFPNQNGELCNYCEVNIDSNIDEIYKNILALLDVDCRRKLLNVEVVLEEWVTFDRYYYENIFDEIKDGLQRMKYKEKDVYKQIVVLYEKVNEENVKQIKLIEFIDIVFPYNLPNKKEVNKISYELLDEAIKYFSVEIANKISSYENMINLSNGIEVSNGKSIEEWLSEFIDYLVEFNYDNLLNKKTKPILPNQNGKFRNKDELFLDSGEIDEILKDISNIAGNDVREEILISRIYLELPANRTRKIENIASHIISYIKTNQGASKSQESIRDTFKKIYIWLCDNQEKAKEYFLEIWKNKHWLFDDYEIAENMKKAEVLDDILKKYNINDPKSLEELLIRNESAENFEQFDSVENEISEELLIQSGIYTKAALDKAMSLKIFGENFIHESEHDNEKFEHVNKILERSKTRVIKFLISKPEYDLSDMIELDKTIFMIKKHGEEMYLIIRPSDYKEVILYYDSERDILDYEKDWELWVEDDSNDPEKITFGKMLKLTGINKIPLKRIR
ncbi:ATP-binding protein [Clostridium gasigenes]|uniref:sacsin N-terminal ATP-binding-like domain-containing protein n=1 Tax=Clostridium gasigenes TaxID=94869 RepID=UPI001C0C5560|nr:ATP-binding protein [Clostridium gasigenes]MBU3135796.1 ATP-binding protein [Clostridium gasigenes]